MSLFSRVPSTCFAAHGALLPSLLLLFRFLKPAPHQPRLPGAQIDPVYRRLRFHVFAGIFFGYAAYYLVRKNFSLAIPDILKDYPQYSKAELGTAMTGLSIAYGFSKFLMGSVSDKSNPRWFLPLGLLLSCAVLFVFGFVKEIYLSLTAMIVLQTFNGWFNGMGWAPCGKTMVHWFSTKERGRAVSIWNVAHNVGGALVATIALWGVTMFDDWGAKFYFNAMVSTAVAVVAFLLIPVPFTPPTHPAPLPRPCLLSASVHSHILCTGRDCRWRCSPRSASFAGEAPRVGCCEPFRGQGTFSQGAGCSELFLVK